MSTAIDYDDQYFDLDEIADVVANDYLRVSRDKSGVLRSPAEQHVENGELCERKRWTLGRSYTDEGSASKYQRKRRVDFDQLVADLRADRFAAHVLIVWEVSRGTRKAGEMETLLDLCQQRGVWIYVYNKRRLFNPHVVDDWEDLMHAAVSAAGESMRTSQRTRRASKADAGNGRATGGRRAFGYEAAGGKVNKTEAAIVKDCVRRVLAGESVRSIAADLNRRGIKTSAGNDWHPGPLRNMLAGYRIAGVRAHKGRPVAKGQWEAIIGEDQHRRVVATLATRTPVGRRGRTSWVLTGFLRCELCRAVLSGNTDTGGTRRYVCRKGPGYPGCGSLTIKAAVVEKILGELVTERLTDVEARRHAEAGPDDAGELAELDRIAAVRVELSDDYAAGKISRDTKNEDAAALDRRQRSIESELAAKVRTTAPLDFVAAEGYIGRPWASLDVEEQRLILGALVEHVTIGPAVNRGSNRPEPKRVDAPGRITWKI